MLTSSPLKETEDFISLFSSDPLHLLKHLKSENIDLFNKQILSIHDNKSLFSNLYFNKGKYNIEYSTEQTLLFFIENGFDFTRPIKFYPNLISEEKYNKWNPKKYNEEIFCDYLLYFSYLPNSLSFFLTEYIYKIKPDFIQSLPDNGYYLLHIAMSKENVPLVKKLFEIGLSPFTKDHNKKTVEDYAKSNSSCLKLYDELIEQYYSSNNKEDKFKSTLEWLISNAKNISNTSSDYYSDQYLEYLKSSLPKYSIGQQEEMIATSLYSGDFTLLSKSLKLINQTNRTYNPQVYPLWKNLGNAGTQLFLYYFLETKKIPLSTVLINNNNNEYFLSEVTKFLQKNHLTNFRVSSTGNIMTDRGSEGSKQMKVFSLLQQRVNVDFLLSENKYANNENWFTTICTNRELFKTLINYIKYISPFSCSIHNNDKVRYFPEEFQKLISNTWFLKNSNNQYNIDEVLKTSPYLMDDRFYFSQEKHFLHDEKTPLYTTEQKKIIFEHSFNLKMSHGRDIPIADYNYLMTIINNLKNDEKFLWNDFSINDNIRELANEYNSKDNKISSRQHIINEIDKIKSYHSLNHSLLESDNQTRKNKI